MQTMYRFGFGTAEGDGSMKELLGGKGAGLAHMAKLGLPIPPGVTLITDLCASYEAAPSQFCTSYASKVLNAFEKFVVPEMGYLPLLSVRSGARVSMPGMMDTILNVGITSANRKDWIKRLGERATLDSERRLIQMFGSTVTGIPSEVFEATLEEHREEAGAVSDSDLSVADLKALVEAFRDIYVEYADEAFPDTVEDQLAGCIGAVFRSWNSERAVEYRIANQIPHDWGTAVTVQAMVFGNLNDKSATGVLFTRDPNSGEPGLFGEFLINAQGEDVVAGIRTPEPLAAMAKWNKKVHTELTTTALKMEQVAGDMQDMEFTVQDGKLFILQTRSGKRSARAAFRIAYDMVHGKNPLAPEAAIKRVTGKQYMALMRPSIATGFNILPTFTGIPGGGPVVTGRAVMSSGDAKASKEPCILVREETVPDDFPGMMAAVGILTRTGGATSHAAVVARGMDKACVVGVTGMKPGYDIKSGDMVTIDGATGRVWVNIKVPVQQGSITKEATALLEMARAVKGAEAAVLTVALPEAGWESVLPESGEVHLDLSELCKGQQGRARTMQVLQTLQSRKGLTGLISFLPSPAAAIPDSKLLEVGLGLHATFAVNASGPTLQHLVPLFSEAKWTKAVRARWLLRGPSALLDVAESYGWAVEDQVATMADLFMAAGPVMPTPGFMDMLETQNLTLDKVFEHLKPVQPDLKVLPQGVDADTAVFALLG